MRMTPDTEESVRCTVSRCNCVCFKPGGVQLRSCDRCGHGWVAHALEKLHFQALQPSGCGPVEVALPGLVFDLSSLVLYGAQAIPVQLKILLDRLYSILTPEEVGHILHTLGWSLGDYVRGYMLQFPSGKVLDRWVMVTPEEELLILKHFLRFGETRPLVELMMRQCLAAASHHSNPEMSPAPKGGGTQAVSRGGPRLMAGACRSKDNTLADPDNIVHQFENLTDGQSLFLPFHFSTSPLRSLVPPTKELISPSKLTQTLHKPKLAEKPSQEGGRGEQEYDPILHQFKPEPPLNIKVDPDKPNPASSLWHQDLHFNNEHVLHLPSALAKQQNTSLLSSSLNSSRISTSSSLHPSISSSPPNIPQKFQSSSSYSFNPLPSLSSSFLSHLPSSSSFFSSSLHPQPSSSSSLHPLPSSLCSAPSLSSAGGRKGRVCCGICGKSFYDKGTLKIHYNAVHLKIKHRCTVAGCTMVFSSLRSRNRHSANPNPRLHTAASIDGHGHSDLHTSTHPETEIHKDKIKNMRREKQVSSPPCIHTLRNGFNGHANPKQNNQETTPPQADSHPPSPQPTPCTLSQDCYQNFNVNDSRAERHPKALPPPSPPRPIACSALSLGSPPSLIPLAEKTERHRHSRNHAAPAAFSYLNTLTGTSCYSPPVSHDHGLTDGQQGKMCTSPPTSQQRRWQSGESVPKKKPRKSSMPVKIEREGGGGFKIF